MSASPIVDRIRIIPRSDDFLDRNVGSGGEVFFNRATNSLRVYSGKSKGGFEIARADLDNISNDTFAAKAVSAGVGAGSQEGTKVDVSIVAPSDPEVGNIWFNSTNGKLYVYVSDADDTAQWVQPAVPLFSGNYNDLTNVPVFATVATTGSYNDLIDRPNLAPIATSGSYNDITNAPTFATVATSGSYADLENISVTLESIEQSAATDGQVLSWSNSLNRWQPISISSLATGNFTFTGSVLDTDDSSGITVTPLLTTQSDLIVENDLQVRNNLTAQSVSAEQFINNGIGAAELQSGSTLTLDAVEAITLRSTEGVRVESGAFRLPSLTTTERNLFSAANGDVIYNTTDNKIQGYQNGIWINLDGS